MSTIQIAKEYADLILKGPLGELGEILTDTIGSWRLKNQIRLLLKTKQWMEDRGVNPKPLLPENFVPILVEVSNVEDETLANMFASLLANSLDQQSEDLIHPSYSKVLSQLSSFDAKVLLEFRKWTSYKGAREVGLRGRPITAVDISSEFKSTFRSAYLSCLNLSRLGIVEHLGPISATGHPIPILVEALSESQQYIITEYGIEFCDACKY